MGKTLVAAPLLPISAITANHAAAGYPVTNLRSPQVRGGDRAHSGNLGLWRVDADLGAVIPWNLLGLIYTNATEQAGIRWRAAATQAALDTAPVYDTVPFGTCLRCDGIDDLALASDAGSLGALTSWTISCRVKPRVLRRQAVLLLSNAAGTLGGVLSMRAGDGALRFWAHPALGVNLIGPVPTTDAFTRVSCTYDSGTQIAQLIVNGVLAAQATGVAAWLTSTALVVAGSPVSPDAFFDGQIDDIRVWDHARTPAQDLADLGSELVGTETGLVGYWKLNEGTGASASNSVGGGSAATVIGALWHMPDPIWWSPDLDGIPHAHNYQVHQAGVGTSRWIRAEVIDAANPAGYFGAGRLVVANGWITRKGRRYGDRFGSRERSERTYLHGATPVLGSGLRQTQGFTVVSDSVEELRKAHLRMRHAAGSSSPVVVLHDYEDAAMRHWNSIYGLLGDDVEMSEPHRGIGELDLEVEEM